MSNNITNHIYNISKELREKNNGHKSFLIWFTGLSGSGKSTLANLLELELHKNGISTYVLDGDNIRSGINKDLSFTPNDRKENIRRISEIAKLFVDAGIVTLATFVSPYEEDRQLVRTKIGVENFIEVYINASVEECKNRDVKGLYKKAELGEIKNMTGVNSPYEVPLNPDIEILTEKLTVEDSLHEILSYIKKKYNLGK